jgi:antitoxin MazE
MQTKLRKIGNGYGVLLPKQLIDTLRLSEGDVLTLTETDSGIELSPFDTDFSEQVEAFRRTESRHRNSYRELAK